MGGLGINATFTYCGIHDMPHTSTPYIHRINQRCEECVIGIHAAFSLCRCIIYLRSEWPRFLFTVPRDLNCGKRPDAKNCDKQYRIHKIFRRVSWGCITVYHRESFLCGLLNSICPLNSSLKVSGFNLLEYHSPTWLFPSDIEQLHWLHSESFGQ